MQPGPAQVVACPNCDALAWYPTIASGNTFGARLWTDGKQEAPMMPMEREVARCVQCGECYWIEDAAEVGEFGPWEINDPEVDPLWTTAPEAEEPTEVQYYEALNKGLGSDEDRERRARIAAWWLRNDELRVASSSADACPSVESEENMVTLEALLRNGGDEDQIMRGELLRELGKFDEAQEVLNAVTEDEFADVVQQIQQLCEQGDVRVREFRFEDD